MARAAVSTCVDYNQPAVTTVVTKHCGEVYCSEKLEDFVVICTKCSQAFTLLSSKLFIKHMQSCLSVEIADLGFEIQPNPNYTTDIAGSREPSEKFDEGECRNFDLLSPVKVKIETSDDEAPIDEVTLGEYKAEAVFIEPFIETEGVKHGEHNILSHFQINDQYQQTEGENDHQPLIGEDKADEEEEDDDISKTITLSTIEEYEKHPLLWDINLFRASCRASRFLALQEITNALNIKYNKSFDVMTIRRKIFLLRKNYRRVQRTKEAFEREHPNEEAVFPIHLYYFDQMSFIGTTFNDAHLGSANPSFTEQVIEPNNDEPLLIKGGEDSGRSDKEEPDLFQGPLSRNRKLLTCIVEEYKKQSHLWSSIHYGKGHTVRRAAYAEMANAIHKRTGIKFPIDRLSVEVRRLRSVYFRFVRTKEQNPGQRTLLWYANILSFIENKNNVDDAEEEDNKYVNSDGDYSISESEEFHVKRKQDQSKEHILAIIELYKAAPVLWDTSHAEFAIRCVRREAFENILSTLSSKHDCRLTVAQLRYQLRYIKECYFRALRYNITAENGETANDKQTPYFYDRLSFLEPLANHQQKTARYLYHQNRHKAPIKCDLCDFTASSKTNLKIHMHRHNRVTPHRSKICDKSFVTSNELRRHNQKHTGKKPFICEICGKKLPAKSKHHLHMRRHRNQRDHKCEVSGSAFFDPKGLQNHMVVHSDERKYACDVCGAIFKLKFTLAQHKKLHDEKKKYACRICGKCFAQQAGLYSHMKSHCLVAENSSTGDHVAVDK